MQTRNKQDERYEEALRFFERRKVERAQKAAEQEQVLLINGVEIRVRPAER